MGDMRSVLSPKMRKLPQSDPAYLHLSGEPYLYANLYELVQEALKKQGKMSPVEIRVRARKALYPTVIIDSTIKKLNRTANIGYVDGKYIWYERKPQDVLTETALDEWKD